jgi:hypothetical protein
VRYFNQRTLAHCPPKWSSSLEWATGRARYIKRIWTTAPEVDSGFLDGFSGLLVDGCQVQSADTKIERNRADPIDRGVGADQDADDQGQGEAVEQGSAERNMAITTIRVVPEVMTERDIVWLSDALTTSLGAVLRIGRKFSRMRSKITMVSFTE